MLLDIDSVCSANLAIVDDSGHELSYGDVCKFVADFKELGLPRCVAFCLCENSAGSLCGYVAMESCGVVPLLLSANLDEGLLQDLDSKYCPSYYWLPETASGKVTGECVFSGYGYSLVSTGHDPYPLNEHLSLLLTTSGSTGSSKLVRHKYGNIESSARNVARAFEWTPDERSLCSLPMNYTMGLNVINSHLAVGAAVLLAKAGLTDSGFWDFAKEWRGTNFCGVPFSYEIMKRVGFDKMELPYLRTLAQGGGRLTDKLFDWLVSFAENSGKRFCATFGTTETSARMAMLPPELANEKTGSIGRAIPGGYLFLADEVQEEDGWASGELCYRGPNVTMGYAVCIEDLLLGDVFCGEYHTGDLARRDPDGCYYVTGRKSRFLKLFGLRVGLDEVEGIVKAEFACDCACAGTDKRMDIYVADCDRVGEVVEYVSAKTKIHPSAFRAYAVSEIPRNEYGKIRFTELENLQ